MNTSTLRIALLTATLAATGLAQAGDELAASFARDLERAPGASQVVAQAATDPLHALINIALRGRDDALLASFSREFGYAATLAGAHRPVDAAQLHRVNNIALWVRAGRPGWV